MTVILVWLLRHEWTFHLVGLLRPSAYQNVATLHFAFYKALCIEPSVSAIHFTSYLFLARARRRLSTGTGVLPKVSDPSVCSYNTIALNSLI